MVFIILIIGVLLYLFIGVVISIFANAFDPHGFDDIRVHLIFLWPIFLIVFGLIILYECLDNVISDKAVKLRDKLEAKKHGRTTEDK